MNLYLTEFIAKDLFDGELKTYAGPRIEAISFQKAEEYCRKFHPYLRVIGELEAEMVDEGVIHYNYRDN
ncbi:MAG: hypothetical protein ACK5XN_27045 [Bacteroidota bacterium]